MEIVMPPMDDEQIEWCVEMLQTTAKYKDIAILFRDKFDWFAPDFDQETFCERFVSRLNDLVNNKRRPYAARIAEGRKKNQKSTDHVWMTHEVWREENGRRFLMRLRVSHRRCGRQPIQRVSTALNTRSTRRKHS